MTLLSKSKYKYFRSLKIKKNREQETKFLVEGIKFCNDALTANIDIEAFLFCPLIVHTETINSLQASCEKQHIPCFEITPDMLTSLSDTVHSQGVICIAKMMKHHFNFDKAHFILMVDAVQEPGNLGTIIRTADWFGLDWILLGKGTVDLYNPKVLRATMGSIFHIPILKDINLIKIISDLKRTGFSIYIADINGEHLINTVQYAQRKILIIGNESKGISPEILELADKTVRIPSKGKAESLNVAVAHGILINEMTNYVV